MKLEVKNLYFSYRSDIEVIKDVSFSVDAGDCIAVLGINGVGKTTMIKCINRIIKPNSGEIFLDGKSTLYMNGNEVARNIGYVPQGCEFVDGSVFDTVLLGRKPFIKWDVTSEDLEIVQNVLYTMNLETFADRNVNALSGGERQKVSIARALAQQASVLLFDEPTSNLDIKNQLEVLDIIKRIVKSQKLTAIVVIHDLNLALRFADKFLIMKNGTVYNYGDESVINSKTIYEVYGINVDVIKHGEFRVVIPK
ncbi:MAG: ABC transporter ATP-binding protein [Ruminococcaceae bacterium]|nr:ABC transporter ATP-binding protein [Oscillospiraceae bacterium]